MGCFPSSRHVNHHLFKCGTPGQIWTITQQLRFDDEYTGLFTIDEIHSQERFIVVHETFNPVLQCKIDGCDIIQAQQIPL